MKKIVFGFMSTVSAVALIFAYPTSHNATSQASETVAEARPQATATLDAQRPASSGTTSGTANNGVSGGVSSGTSGNTASGQTYTGAAYSTPYGPVQVEVTVNGGQVTSAQATAYPDSNGKDIAINSRAIPLLNAAAASSTGRISAVSGATFTSEAYAQSLQSALDKAGL